MAGKKGNKKHANKTSYPNQKRNDKNPKVVLKKFFEMYNNAINDNEILCFQDACLSIGWRASKVDYWVNKIPTFENLKKDIQKIITSRINKEALTGGFVPAPAIWRMKMLGESETIKNDITSGGKTIESKTSVEISYKDMNED